MAKRIKSSDVLDVNAITLTDIKGEVFGHYSTTGPNRWDDYEFIRAEETEIVDVPIHTPIHLELLGADHELRFRVRKGRKVLRIRWIPSEEDKEQLATGKWGVQESKQATLMERIFKIGPEDDPRDDMLEYFLDIKAEPYEPDPGLGLEVMLVKKLQGKG